MIISIGIDVSKSDLEISTRDRGFSIRNDEDSIRKAFEVVEEEVYVVLEATGKYHRLAQRILSELGYIVAVINPFQARHFAKALNLRCKTDKVDAQVLRIYGERMPMKKSRLASEQQERCQGLSRYLLSLRKTSVEYRLRQRENVGQVKESLGRIIKEIENEIKEVQGLLLKEIEETEALAKKVSLLSTIPGIGKPTAIMLVCLLSELGALSKNQIGSLAGLAPLNQDSGQHTGKRRIGGGRHDIRAELYMPTLGAATRHNERLQVIYTRLIAKGKPAKVALTACMRKLIVWANAILASGEGWDNTLMKDAT